MKLIKFLSLLMCAACLLMAGCSPSSAQTASPRTQTDEPLADSVSVSAEALALARADAAIAADKTVSAPGVDVRECYNCIIDYSNIVDGYVMVCYSAQTDKRLKVQVKGPTATYSYNLPIHKWQAFPLSDGNGSYQISVYKNIADNRYAAELELFLEVELADETAPFLRSNQYVNFDDAPQTRATAAAITASVTKPLEKVVLIYDYVTEHLRYNHELAASVQSGYLPDLDAVLELGKGICFDYASLMTGMLRSCGIPCKLVVGYMDDSYHAWISVYSGEDGGWIDAMYFDGTSWQRLDPTIDSGKLRSFFARRDDSSYVAKYFY